MKVLYNDQEYILVKQESSSSISKYSELVKIKCLLTDEVLSVPKSKVIYLGDVK